jgi:hypothetical protein
VVAADRRLGAPAVGPQPLTTAAPRRGLCPWLAATSEPALVEGWLAAVGAAGMAPHVAFEHLRSCPSCTIVAGDVLDSGSYGTWLRRFLAASNASGRTTFSASEAQAAAAIDRAFALAATRPRIARMYVYEWQAFPGDTFDSGLVRPDGTARPSLAALTRNLAALATTAAPAPLRWAPAWSKTHPRQLVLTGTCRTTVVRCTGSITATVRTRAGGAARATFARVATRRAYATTSAKRTVTLRISLSSKAWHAARAAPTRRLVLAIAATRPASSTAKTVLKLARPR